MALATEPTYSTFAQFQARTPVSTQAGSSLLEATWKPFALRAETILDSHVIVPKGMMFDRSQSLKFPIKDEYGNSLMPDDVTLAVIEITSDLILKGDPQAQTGVLETNESWDGSGYSIAKQKKSNSSSEDLKIEMPPLARRLLMPWTDKVAPLRY